jgi:hypothetical protein
MLTIDIRVLISEPWPWETLFKSCWSLQQKIDRIQTPDSRCGFRNSQKTIGSSLRHYFRTPHLWHLRSRARQAVNQLSVDDIRLTVLAGAEAGIVSWQSGLANRMLMPPPLPPGKMPRATGSGIPSVARSPFSSPIPRLSPWSVDLVQLRTNCVEAEHLDAREIGGPLIAIEAVA